MYAIRSYYDSVARISPPAHARALRIAAPGPSSPGAYDSNAPRTRSAQAAAQAANALCRSSERRPPRLTVTKPGSLGFDSINARSRGARSARRWSAAARPEAEESRRRITSYNVCYTKLLRAPRRAAPRRFMNIYKPRIASRQGLSRRAALRLGIVARP